MAYTAWRGVKYLKGLVNSELFSLDATSTGTVSNIGSMTHITAIAQGDGVNGRTGNSILAKSVYIKMQLTKDSAATNTRVRLVLVRDNQQISDTAPSIANIYGSASTIAPIQSGAFGRFTILYDKTFNLTADNPQVNTRVFQKLNHHVRYNGTADTDQQKNAIYWIQMSNEATNVPDYERVIRFRYHDN